MLALGRPARPRRDPRRLDGEPESVSEIGSQVEKILPILPTPIVRGADAVRERGPLASWRGLGALPRRLVPACLTVLSYGRGQLPLDVSIGEPRGHETALRTSFERQLGWAYRWFEPVSLADVVAHCEGAATLPPRSLLVAFEDGLRLWTRIAFPALRRRGIPSAIFVATHDLSATMPVLTELVGYCFRRTSRRSARLPALGEREWRSGDELHRVVVDCVRWVRALPEVARRPAVRALAERLEVVVPTDALAGPHLTWDDLRALAADGVELALRAPSAPPAPGRAARIERELADSLTWVAAETGRSVRVLAHVTPGDGRDARAFGHVLDELGIAAAFSLGPGPSTLAEVRRAPHAIRRVTLTPDEPLVKVALKVAGLPRAFSRRARS